MITNRLSPKIDNLPHLLKLLDDDSKSIRNIVFQELRSFGSVLDEKLAELNIVLTPLQERLLFPLLEGNRRNLLRNQWPSWFSLNTESQKLEKAFDLIAEFQLGKQYGQRLGKLLDSLANEFRKKYKNVNEFNLAKFLFGRDGLSGTEMDYYNPQNSNLVSVILNKSGIPISLVSIYMLVGNRLQMEIEGCNFPGHFLARIFKGETLYLVDGYSGGEVINGEDIRRFAPPSSVNMEEFFHRKTTAFDIIERVIRNLIRGYQLSNNRVNSYFMLDLLNILKEEKNRPERLNKPFATIPISNKGLLYKPGRLVRHKRFGYRGVIVDFDLTCCATEIWYQGNETQPERTQPWYHVLLDKATYDTYAAQSNLVPDTSIEEISHPLIQYYFTKFYQGTYLRNQVPWNDVDP